MPITLKTVFLILALIAAVPSASAQPCRDDEMAIQILGSGGPFVNPHRASTSHIVWLDGRSRILVDVRGGTFLRFGQAEARLADLSVILISHLHPDHVSDLPALLWLSNVARKDPLPLVGPDGNDSVPSVSTFLSRLFDGRQGGFPMLSATLGGSRSTVPLEVTVVNPSRQGHSPVFDRNGITVSAMAVPHANVPSIAYRVRTGQGTVVFGSDQSGENPHFAEFASNADVLVMHLNDRRWRDTSGARFARPGRQSRGGGTCKTARPQPHRPVRLGPCRRRGSETLWRAGSRRLRSAVHRGAEMMQTRSTS